MPTWLIRWCIFTAFITTVGISITSSFTSSASFEDTTLRIIAVEKPQHGSQCAIKSDILLHDPLWLVDICAQYGVSAYEAAARYPAVSPKIFRLYGEVPEFQNILDTYGHQVIPVINFFLENGSTEYLNKVMVSQWLTQFKGGARSSKEFIPPTRLQYGLLAILETKATGHDFLGQFTIKDGIAMRLQVKHVISETERVLTGGIVKLEEVLRRGERKPTAGEVASAAIDGTVLLGASVKALSLLKGVGKLARTGEVIEEADTTVVEATELSESARTLEIAQTVGKAAIIAAPVGFTVFAITHPIWTTQYAGWLAKKMGMSPWFGMLSLWLIIGGIVAVFLPWLLPLLASMMLWLTFGLMKISAKTGIRVSTFAISKGITKIRSIVKT